MGRIAANRNDNAPSERWKRSIFFASRLQDANNPLQQSGVDKPQVKKKELEVQHWLELIDGYVSNNTGSPSNTESESDHSKHRYGSNR